MYLYDTEVEILVNGKPVKKFSHNGKTYIQANKGSEYSIRVKNNSSSRRMFNVSVDGINVVNGEAAGKIPFGYVLNGYSSYEIKGFRTSNEEVHPFKFNDKQASYAAKSEETGGDVSNCGVIGVQVYEEKAKPLPTFIPNTVIIREVEKVPYTPWNPEPWRPSPIWYGTPLYTCNTTATTGSMSMANNTVTASYNCNVSDLGGGEMLMRSCNMASNLSNTSPKLEFCASVSADVEEDVFSAGTEFSKNAVADKVSDVEFETGRLLVSIEIFYAYREGLLAMGVPVTKEVKMPSAFPARFCKPPKS